MTANALLRPLSVERIERNHGRIDYAVRLGYVTVARIYDCLGRDLERDEHYTPLAYARLFAGSPKLLAAVELWLTAHAAEDEAGYRIALVAARAAIAEVRPRVEAEPQKQPGDEWSSYGWEPGDRLRLGNGELATIERLSGADVFVRTDAGQRLCAAVSECTCLGPGKSTGDAT
jgi:hypothetical protein